MATTHEFPDDRVHFTWDEGNEPVLTIESGDTVVYETRDVSDNQITPDSTAEAIATLDWDRVYPLAGPVLVEGAEPGDTLAIEILAMETRGWGYTLIIPGDESTRADSVDTPDMTNVCLKCRRTPIASVALRQA